MLLEIAIGDAYGAGFEFSAREKIVRGNTLARYLPHDLGMEAGRYTDDTQMSIAVSETLMSTEEPTSEAFADAFVRCFKRDPRKGYSKRLERLLEASVDGSALRRNIDAASRRNGAAMRSVPLGLISDKQLLASTAKAQAAVTHDTVEGVLSSHAIALMGHALLYEGARLVDLPAVVKAETAFDLDCDWNREVECDALQTLHAVSTALLRNRSLSSLLIDCVAFGGDVDSVAAIAMGLASLSQEYASDVPEALMVGLEHGEYGATFLIGLDEALAERYPVLRLSPHRIR